MPNSKKILINLPCELLADIDSEIRVGNENRSEFIREAIKNYLVDRRKIRIREEMKKGYEEIGMLNLRLSEEGLKGDTEFLAEYEKMLAESE